LGHLEFLASLPRQCFTELEVLLYRALFSFLASWRPARLATLDEAAGDEQVKRACSAFLPRRVPLQAWVEQRIGGEIEFSRGGSGNDLLIGLRPAGVRTLSTWNARQQERVVPATIAPALVGSSVESVAEAYGGQTSCTRQFFETLQPSKLAPPEVRLRAALIDYLRGWRPETPPLLDEVQTSSAVVKFYEALIPRGVAFRQWIEYRIGAEVQVHENPKRQWEILLQEDVRRFYHREESPQPSGHGDPYEGFFVSLPPDEFLPQEMDLRRSILDWMHRWQDSRRNKCPLMSEMMPDPDVSRNISATLTPGVPLHAWIDRRIGSEVGVLRDLWGRRRLQMKGSESRREAARNGKSSSKAAREDRSRRKASKQSPQGNTRASQQQESVEARSSRRRQSRRQCADSGARQEPPRQRRVTVGAAPG